MSIFHFNGKQISFDCPLVMSIINLNEDSFYNKSRLTSNDDIFQFIELAIANDSKIIDLGAISSRPYAQTISEDEEIKRLIPKLKLIRTAFPDVVISIDTWRAEVARLAIEEGADMINDIYASKNDEMTKIIAHHNIPYIMMHMQGEPTNMQDEPRYNNVCLDVLSFLKIKKTSLNAAGANQLIIDPGFGFGKSISDNYVLLKKLSVFKVLELPILAGLSRKSMIYKSLDIDADLALNGTTALNMYALFSGAKILRVHDPVEANQVIKLFKRLSIKDIN